MELNGQRAPFVFPEHHLLRILEHVAVEYALSTVGVRLVAVNKQLFRTLKPTLERQLYNTTIDRKVFVNATHLRIDPRCWLVPPKLTHPLADVTHLQWFGPTTGLDVSFFPNLEVLVIKDEFTRNPDDHNDRSISNNDIHRDKVPLQLIDLQKHSRLRVCDIINVYSDYQSRFSHDKPFAIRLPDTLETFVCHGMPVFYTDDNTEETFQTLLPSQLTTCALSCFTCWKIVPDAIPLLEKVKVASNSNCATVHGVAYASYTFPKTLKHLIAEQSIYYELPSNLETFVSLFPNAVLEWRQVPLPHLKLLCTREAGQLDYFKRVLIGSDGLREKLITEADNHCLLAKLLGTENTPKRESSLLRRQQCHENYLFYNKRLLLHTAPNGNQVCILQD